MSAQAEALEYRARCHCGALGARYRTALPATQTADLAASAGADPNGRL